MRPRHSKVDYWCSFLYLFFFGETRKNLRASERDDFTLPFSVLLLFTLESKRRLFQDQEKSNNNCECLLMCLGVQEKLWTKIGITIEGKGKATAFLLPSCNK
jgi:hypothetical protein